MTSCCTHICCYLGWVLFREVDWISHGGFGRGVNVTPSPPPHYLCLLTIPLLTPAGDQLVAEGAMHISLPTQEYDRGNGENRRTNEQTRTSLGLTKSRGRYATLCVPDSIYGLTLAWVTSENSTMLLKSDSSWLTLAGPYPMLPRLSAPVSGVDCPCPFFHANCPLCSPAANCPLCSPAANCPLVGRVVNSHSRPLTTSGYGEISCPRILCLVSRQNRLVCFGGLPT